MGGTVEVSENPTAGPEPAGEIRARHASLEAITVDPAEATELIDELPLLAVVATQAEGASRIRGASELRVKESDRITGLVTGLRALGAGVEEHADGLTITGPTPLHAASVDALGDHRLAMAFTVAGLVADGTVHVRGMDRTADSFPGFVRTVEALT
jgi:3-phosphoshikimate 1-carboxyvinyltransferase